MADYTGFLYDPTGHIPLVGVKVQAHNATTGVLISTVLTDSTGKWDFGNLSVIPTIYAYTEFGIRLVFRGEIVGSIAGSVDLVTSGALRVNATGVLAGDGAYIDYNAGTPRFRVGTISGGALAKGVYWDGANLAWIGVNTSLTAAGAFVATSATITGTINATAGYFGDGATRVAIEAAGLNVGNTGSVRGGQTAYDTGTGFWLGYSTTYKLSIGNSAGNKLTWDGTTLAITGTITASAGTIGGWTIGATFIYFNGVADANSSGMASADFPFYAGAFYINRATAPFRVTPAGALFASSATITGAITATSGSIGSFTIGTYLYTGSKTAWNDANAGVHLGSDGIGIGNNVFTVNGSTGALVATSATITGAITATSGTIGGWTIGASFIYNNGMDEANSAGMAPVDWPFYAGAYYINRATAPFRVNPAGVLTATSATITGTITATAGSLSGLDISGVLTVGTSGGIFQGTGSFASPTTALKIYNSGGIGLLEMWGSGVKQVYLSTDGKLYAGGGDIIIDSSGLTLASGAEKMLFGTSTYKNWLWGDSSPSASNIYLRSGTSNAVRVVTLEVGSANPVLDFYFTINSVTTHPLWVDDDKIVDIVYGLTVDTINEFTSAAGVTIDSVLLKDGGLTLGSALNMNNQLLSGAYYLATTGADIAGVASGDLRLGGSIGLLAGATVDGRDISADLNQAVKTTDSPTFVGLTLTGSLGVTGSTLSAGSHYVRGGPANASYSSTAQTLYTNLSASMFGVINQPSGYAVGLLGINEDSAATNAQFYGLVGVAINNNTANAKTLACGTQGEAMHQGAGNAGALTLVGTSGVAINQSAYNVGNATSLFASTVQNNGAGSITNVFGLYIQPQTVGTNKWDIYHEGTAPNIGMGNGGTLTWKDAAGNTLMSLVDVGTVGDLLVRGKLGVGSTDPAVKVEIQGAGGSQEDVFRLKSVATAGGHGPFMSFEGASGATITGAIGQEDDGVLGESDFVFRMSVTGAQTTIAGLTEILRIKHDGGIALAGNMVVTGVYGVDGIQVVGNRVIDARCDDAINSGDATTDGVIDSLRDAMIAHGLIAAA